MDKIMKMLGGGGGGDNCVKRTQAKYRNRPSPAFPANECCDKTMKGNDGLMYKSVRNKKGICTWKRKSEGGAKKMSRRSRRSRRSRWVVGTRKGTGKGGLRGG